MVYPDNCDPEWTLLGRTQPRKTQSQMVTKFRNPERKRSRVCTVPKVTNNRRSGLC